MFHDLLQGQKSTDLLNEISETDYDKPGFFSVDSPVLTIDHLNAFIDSPFDESPNVPASPSTPRIPFSGGIPSSNPSALFRSKSAPKQIQYIAANTKPVTNTIESINPLSTIANSNNNNTNNNNTNDIPIFDASKRLSEEEAKIDIKMPTPRIFNPNNDYNINNNNMNTAININSSNFDKYKILDARMKMKTMKKMKPHAKDTSNININNNRINSNNNNNNTDLSMKNVLILYNPISGGKNGNGIDLICEIMPIFSSNNVNAILYETQSKHDLTKFLTNDENKHKILYRWKIDTFIIIGGDGTISDFINGYMIAKYYKYDLNDIKHKTNISKNNTNNNHAFCTRAVRNKFKNKKKRPIRPLTVVLLGGGTGNSLLLSLGIQFNHKTTMKNQNTTTNKHDSNGNIIMNGNYDQMKEYLLNIIKHPKLVYIDCIAFSRKMTKDEFMAYDHGWDSDDTDDANNFNSNNNNNNNSINYNDVSSKIVYGDECLKGSLLLNLNENDENDETTNKNKNNIIVSDIITRVTKEIDKIDFKRDVSSSTSTTSDSFGDFDLSPISPMPTTNNNNINNDKNISENISNNSEKNKNTNNNDNNNNNVANGDKNDNNNQFYELPIPTTPRSIEYESVLKKRRKNRSSLSDNNTHNAATNNNSDTNTRIDKPYILKSPMGLSSVYENDDTKMKTENEIENDTYAGSDININKNRNDNSNNNNTNSNYSSGIDDNDDNEEHWRRFLYGASQSYFGMPSEAGILAEKLRIIMGGSSLRYDVASIIEFIKYKTYKLKLTFDFEEIEDNSDRYRLAPPQPPTPRLDKIIIDKNINSKDNTFDEQMGLIALQKEKEKENENENQAHIMIDDFLILMAMKCKYAGKGMCLTPFAKLNNGYLELLIVKKPKLTQNEIDNNSSDTTHIKKKNDDHSDNDTTNENTSNNRKSCLNRLWSYLNIYNYECIRTRLHSLTMFYKMKQMTDTGNIDWLSKESTVSYVRCQKLLIQPCTKNETIYDNMTNNEITNDNNNNNNNGTLENNDNCDGNNNSNQSSSSMVRTSGEDEDSDSSTFINDATQNDTYMSSNSKINNNDNDNNEVSSANDRKKFNGMGHLYDHKKYYQTCDMPFGIDGEIGPKLTEKGILIEAIPNIIPLLHTDISNLKLIDKNYFAFPK